MMLGDYMTEIEAGEIIADVVQENTQIETEEPQEVVADTIEDAPKKEGGYKRKIKRLESENAAMSQRLAELENTKPIRDNFDTDGEYLESLSEHKVEQKLLSREVNQIQKQAVEENARQFRDTGKEVYPDFEKVLSEFDGISFNPMINEAIGKAGDNIDLAYHLAKNLDDLALLDGIKNPFLFDKALEKIRGKFQVNKVQVKTTKSPPPINPVTPKVTASNLPENNTHDFEAYKRARGIK
jgi:hypothetical protein